MVRGRRDGGRLDWYRNIPVPTSYMCLGSEDDFFGGYDHGAGAGFVHWADHRIAPGKKQWTWGNAPFGWAWDRNLTDGDGPYVELMAGVFTDNQPDFSFLAPGETRAFRQYWYPHPGDRPRAPGQPRRRRQPDPRRRGRPGARGRGGHRRTPAAAVVRLARRRRRDGLGDDVRPRARMHRWWRRSSAPAGRAELTVEHEGTTLMLLAAAYGHGRGHAAGARDRAATAGGDRLGRRAVPHRPAPGAVPPRDALARAVLAGGAAPRPR